MLVIYHGTVSTLATLPPIILAQFFLTGGISLHLSKACLRRDKSSVFSATTVKREPEDVWQSKLSIMLPVDGSVISSQLFNIVLAYLLYLESNLILPIVSRMELFVLLIQTHAKHRHWCQGQKRRALYQKVKKPNNLRGVPSGIRRPLMKSGIY